MKIHPSVVTSAMVTPREEPVRADSPLGAKAPAGRPAGYFFLAGVVVGLGSGMNETE
ncbi:MAG: hypothetical protein QOJ07_1731 [Thermoleophilaceae bacterium]|jgi:hypothetical protein|nr:hypothetical protein [Thermoleophilaceae bacterium]